MIIRVTIEIMCNNLARRGDFLNYFAGFRWKKGEMKGVEASVTKEFCIDYCCDGKIDVSSPCSDF